MNIINSIIDYILTFLPLFTTLTLTQMGTPSVTFFKKVKFWLYSIGTHISSSQSLVDFPRQRSFLITPEFGSLNDKIKIQIRLKQRNKLIRQIFFLSFSLTSGDFAAAGVNSRWIMGQWQVNLVLVVADVVHFIHQWGTVVHDVGGGMAETGAQGASILDVVDGSDRDVIRTICKSQSENF